MTKKQQKQVIKIIVSAIILVLCLLLPINKNYKLVLYLIAYILVGGEIVVKALRNIITGHLLDENFLMTIATIGALITGEYLEGVLVMLLYQIGELFQSYAVGKSRKSIASLMDIRPDYANIEKNGKLEKVDPETIKVKDTIVVKPGEKVPLDGIVVKGSSWLDTSALTGEALPREIKPEDTILSGCINKNGVLTVQVTKEFEESTVSKILDLVENASNKKAKAENFITKFARFYTPTVVILALLLAILPPLFIDKLTVMECIKRAMTFLVISCPCALVISVPLGFFGGIGGASKQGILIKGSNYLETLSKVKTIVFDKTGTLTKGVFTVTKIVPLTIDKSKLLELAALAESYSTHPIALSIKNAYQGKLKKDKINKIEELAGFGIHAVIDGSGIYLGNQKLMKKKYIQIPNKEEIGTVVYVATEKELLGYLVISDEIKKEAKKSLQQLKEKSGVRETVMLTGDSKQVAVQISKELKIDKVYAELLPKDKVEKIEQILSMIPEGENVAFVGDGINDAPVLTRTDIGIAMGGLGSDAAIEAADIVIMDDNLEKINTSIEIAKRTICIVKQNIWFAIGIKVFFLLLGAFGITNMMEAVFADVGVSIIAILNSMRALKQKSKHLTQS